MTEKVEYKPEFAALARNLCSFGANDSEICEALRIDRSVLQRWICNIPDFREAMTDVTPSADIRVRRAIFERATGYYVTDHAIEKKKDPETGKETFSVVETKKWLAADPQSAIFWLKNRMGWSDKTSLDVVNRSNAEQVDLSRLSDEELEQYETLVTKAAGPGQ